MQQELLVDNVVGTRQVLLSLSQAFQRHPAYWKWCVVALESPRCPLHCLSCAFACMACVCVVCSLALLELCRGMVERARQFVRQGLQIIPTAAVLWTQLLLIEREHGDAASVARTEVEMSRAGLTVPLPPAVKASLPATATAAAAAASSGSRSASASAAVTTAPSTSV